MPINTILFDINETVLDLASLHETFKKHFSDEGTTKLWFLNLLHDSKIAALTDIDTTFAELAKIALTNLAHEQSITITNEMQSDILEGMANLHPHPDIIPALENLQQNQFMTVAFSNSSQKLINNQITNAGLSPYFDKVISVEGAKSFKPDPKVYKYAASTLGKEVSELRLIACHDWDTHGAMSAGLQAAYVARHAVPYHPLYKKPDIIGTTMIEVVDKIIQQS